MKMRAAVAAAALVASLLVGGSASGAGCSWPTWLNEDTFNFFFPDESATYWATHVPFVPGGRLVIEGIYPHTRYFSFHAYDEIQRPVDSIADHEVAPDEGSVNPWAIAAGDREPSDNDARRYTVYVSFDPPPAKPEPNTIYAGQMANGQRNPGGFVVYRTYVSDDPDDPKGKVPLPDVTLEAPGGVVSVPFDQCDPLPPDAGGSVNDEINKRDYQYVGPNRSHHPASTDPPTFKRFYGTDQFPRDFQPGNEGNSEAEADSEGGFLSNQQIAYLYAYTSREYGDVLVIRGKAPTFPDTRRGDPVTAPRQVRYWSICQNNGITQRVADCTADHQTNLDDGGYYTVVISDPGMRPKNATPGNEVTWLAWGGAYYDGIVIYRHMLPAGNFKQAIQRVPEGKKPEPILRPFYPTAAYCTTEQFEAGGWKGCFAAKN